MRISINTKYGHSGKLFILLTYIQLIMMLALAFEKTSIIRVCSYGILLLGFSIYLLSICSQRKIKISDGFLIGFIVYLVVLGTAKNWRYENWVAISGFILMLTVWKSGESISYESNVIHWLHDLYLCMGLVLIVLSFSSVAFKGYQDYVSVSSELTLGFDNPNQTALILLSVIGVLYLTREKSSRYLRGIVCVEILILCFLLWQTKSRTSLLGLLLFFVVNYIKIWENNNKYSILITKFLLWVPLCFIYIYRTLANSPIGNWMLFGKKVFGGRIKIYNDVIEQWIDKLFGNIEIFNFQNSHNSHLTILINLGVIGFIFYMFLFSHKITQCAARAKSERQNGALWMILVFFLSGCSEAAMLTGGSIYFVFFLTYVVISGI